MRMIGILLCEAETQERKQDIINIVREGSVITWQHVNMQGEYDFSQEKLSNSINFKLSEILKLQVE